MSVIPCASNPELREQIIRYADVLKEQAHTLGDHGLTEQEFYDSGLFRGAIERVRGQFSATMRQKREFVSRILNWLEDEGRIASWYSAGESNRHDYSVTLLNGRNSVIELKGCLDGNNTNIFERPPQADEFIIWSVCTNMGSDPRHNVWSGIHTRLSSDIISRSQQVDGLVVWDMGCATLGRPCPKVSNDYPRLTQVGQYELPPPCIYLFPRTIPAPRNNPCPAVLELEDVGLLEVLHQSFRGTDDELNRVSIQARNNGAEIERKTTVTRSGVVVAESDFTPIRRS